MTKESTFNLPGEPLDLGPITQRDAQVDDLWQDLNPVVNGIAIEQGVAIGSPEWSAAGVAAWTGQGGAHGSYGWRHHHRITPDFIRAVLANYLSRPIYYSGALHRQFGYAVAGLPLDKPGPNLKGYVTSRGVVGVSGIDVEHAWLEPLWAVIDSDPIDVPIWPGQTMPSTTLARAAATMIVSSIIGMIRSPELGHEPNPWTYGDRANSRILSTIIEAHRRGVLAPEDYLTAGYFVRDVLLPFYEASPGISSFGSAPDGMFSIGLFNGLYWLIPTFYDASQMLMGSSLGDRCTALVERWCQWALDIVKVSPGNGFNAGKVLVDVRAFYDAAGPHYSIRGLLNRDNILSDGITYEHWAFRAADIAAWLLDTPDLEAAREGIFERHKGKPDERQWMVDADGEYVEGE